MTAPVLSCVITCLGRIVMKSPDRAGPLKPTACFVASFSMRVKFGIGLVLEDINHEDTKARRHHEEVEFDFFVSSSCLRVFVVWFSFLLPQDLRDVEIDEVRMVEDDALDCSLDFVALVAVR